MKFDTNNFTRAGKNAVYKGKEYFLSDIRPEPGMVRLLSYKKKIWKMGFVVTEVRNIWK